MKKFIYICLAIFLSGPLMAQEENQSFSLEEAIAYINDDELVEVTPNAIRLRKRYLDPHERKRMSKQN